MFIFDETALKRTLTPWGLAVKLRMVERGVKGTDLIRMLKTKGYTVSKSLLTNLFYGAFVDAHMPEIREITEYLGIDSAERE